MNYGQRTSLSLDDLLFEDEHSELLSAVILAIEDSDDPDATLRALMVLLKIDIPAVEQNIAEARQDRIDHWNKVHPPSS